MPVHARSGEQAAAMSSWFLGAPPLSSAVDLVRGEQGPAEERRSGDVVGEGRG
jgi:hypothetical protein